MKPTSLTLLLVIVLVAGCASPPPDSISAVDVEVLRAVLSGACSRTDDKYSVLSTTPAREDEWRTPQAWEGSAAFDSELVRRSAQSAEWPRIDVCSTIRVVEGETLDAMFASADKVPPGWEEFYRVFPNAAGILEVSLPAFTEEGNRAIVFFEAGCNLMCAAGFYIELKKENGQWRVTRRENAWIA